MVKRSGSQCSTLPELRCIELNSMKTFGAISSSVSYRKPLKEPDWVDIYCNRYMHPLLHPPVYNLFTAVNTCIHSYSLGQIV